MTLRLLISLRRAVLLAAANAACCARIAIAGSPWPPAARAAAEALVATMDNTDLCNLTAARQSAPYQGTVPSSPRFGLPHFGDHDGPQGVAGGFTRVTALPTAMVIAQTWDPALATAFGALNGLEHRVKGANVVLAPGVNLARVPWGGRK